MSPLARLLASRGKQVVGSDRSYDAGRNLSFFQQLVSEGIRIVPQDGSGVSRDIGTFVVTRAVEDSIPDVKKARELHLRFVKRPALMAEIFERSENFAVGGTSGKSTTTGMIGHILREAGKDPTVMNGAVMLNGNSNFINGRSSVAVFEADESDGLNDVISVCPAHVAVLTNISLDHFELDELHTIFSRFVTNATGGVVLNSDCKNSMALRGLHPRTVTFGFSDSADFNPSRYPLSLSIPGEHNRANALAAIAACSLGGVDPQVAIRALASFRGIKRRLEVVGVPSGITVIDDFASNPGKIDAAIATARQKAKRLFAVFQPHGFQPTKMMKSGYIDTFAKGLRDQDILLMPDIYYVGGSANIVNGEVVALPRDISSKDVVDGVVERGRHAYFMPDRREITKYLKKHAKQGDVVLVMGSRDETLSDFAQEIVRGLQ